MSTTTQPVATIRQSVDRLVHAGRYGDARHLLATAVVAGVITNDDALIEFYPLVRPFSDHEHEIVQDALRSGDLGIQKVSTHA